MDEKLKTALAIGGLSVFGAHALLENKVDDRVEQIVSGTTSATSYYLGDLVLGKLGLESKSPLRTTLDLGIAVAAAYLGYGLGEKIVEKYNLDKNDSK